MKTTINWNGFSALSPLLIEINSIDVVVGLFSNRSQMTSNCD